MSQGWLHVVEVAGRVALALGAVLGVLWAVVRFVLEPHVRRVVLSIVTGELQLQAKQKETELTSVQTLVTRMDTLEVRMGKVEAGAERQADAVERVERAVERLSVTIEKVADGVQRTAIAVARIEGQRGQGGSPAGPG